MKNIDVFYVHGGPGLNSEPERLLLSEPLNAAGLNCEFWNEPSTLRPNSWPFKIERAYTNWLESLESAIHKAQPRIVIGASFGALAAMELLEKSPQASVRGLLMLAPTLNLYRVFRKMMEFSARDLEKVDVAKAARLAKFHLESKRFWDSSMKTGFELVWQNPNLLSHYFRKPGALESWAAGLADPAFQIDVSSQNAVFDEIGRMESPRKFSRKLDLPVVVLTGAYDPVFDRHEVEEILNARFENVRFCEVSDCAHFVHIEDKVGFINMIKSMPN